MAQLNNAANGSKKGKLLVHIYKQSLSDAFHKELSEKIIKRP